MFISPILVGIAERVAPRLEQDPLGLPWLLLPLLIVPGMVLVKFVRPDPMQIGLRLGDYYPGVVPPPRLGHVKHAAFDVRTFLKGTTIRLAVLCNCAATGNMSVMMVMTSLVLHHHGHGLAAIAASHAFHSAGMFAFTIPLGRLADRIGRRRIMIVGVATALVSAGFVTFGEHYWLVTLGTFLCGLGWAAANVAATAITADLARTEQRGRAIGLNDSFAAAVTVLMAVVTGPLIDWYGLSAAGILAILLAMMPLAMVPAVLRERVQQRRS
jgi:MFS family permease